jgi:hypothetical protein
MVFRVNFHLKHMIEFLKTSSYKTRASPTYSLQTENRNSRTLSAVLFVWVVSSHCSRSFCEHAAHHRSLENLETNLLRTTEPIQFAFRTTYVLFSNRRRSFKSICIYNLHCPTCNPNLENLERNVRLSLSFVSELHRLSIRVY